MATRAILMWAFYMYVWSQASPGPPADAPAAPAAVPVAERQLLPAWPAGARFDLRLYTAPSPDLSAAAAARLEPLWAEDGLTYDWADANRRALTTSVAVPPAVAAANGSLYAHVFFAPPGLLDAAAAAPAVTAAADDAGGAGTASTAAAAAPPADRVDALAAAERAGQLVHSVTPLVVWSPAKPKRKTKSLLDKKGKPTATDGEEAGAEGQEEEEEEEEEEEAEDTGGKGVLPVLLRQVRAAIGRSAAAARGEASAPPAGDAPTCDAGDDAGAAAGTCAAPGGGTPPTLADAVRAAAAAAGAPKGPPTQLWTPELSVSLVTGGPIILSKLPPGFSDAVVVGADGATFVPTPVWNDVFILHERRLPVTADTTVLPLNITYAPVSVLKAAMYAQMEQLWATQRSMGLSSEGDAEEMKRMLVETNPMLLGTTAVVSLLHTVLEMLAFKSDVAHWRRTTSMEGISVRSMFWKLGMDVVVLLYLLDNETSWMIVMSAALGVLLEVWKLRKAVRVKSFGSRRIGGILPWFEFEDRESYSRTTKAYDDEAMRLLSWLLYPCVGAYAAYSLIYQTHRSWYSWVLRSAVGAVYAFGFLMMLPQVFINYKLKSVAHLPIKALAYKAVNTVIDDLFAFIIKMPALHRLACFRDDLVFAIFLYQRWAYRVDMTRVNEFGQSFSATGEETTGAPPVAEGSGAAAPAVAAAGDDTKRD